jgi:hypothetical protein
VDNEPTFSGLYDYVDTEQSSWTPIKGYGDGTYYWRVAVYDGAGKIGAYSDYQTFTKQYPITTLVSPISGAHQNTTPTFVWTPVDGAASYKLQVSKVATFATTYDSITTPNTRFTPTMKYPNGSTYYWRVAIVDANGNIGPYSDATVILNPLVFLSRSVAAQDGWILETGENTNLGGTKSPTTTTLRLGDDAARKQYRAILSFTTSGLPDNAVITKITLKLKRQGVIGGLNPITTFQGFMVDIKKGIFGVAALESADWQTTASKTYGPFKPALIGGWYNINLTSAQSYINKLATTSGLTQIRLRFKLDDNNNGLANYLSLFSGNAPAASRPQLIIEYYVP